MNTKIKSVHGRAGIDCKGKPLLEVDVVTEDGILGRAASPSGISAGMYEAFVLRDGDRSWYHGAGVFQAVEKVNKVIGPAIAGMDVLDQEALDQRLIALDGTKNKSNLGGNSIYSVSLAVLRAAAAIQNLPLYRLLNPAPVKSIPLPTANCFSGGSYQKNSMPFQEITIVPYQAASLQDAVHTIVSIYGNMPKAIEAFSGKPAIPGSLSSFKCPSTSPDDAYAMVSMAAEMAGMRDKIAFAADCAFSEVYDPKKRTYRLVDREMTTTEVIETLQALTEKYNFLYIEDPIDENDWEGWSLAAKHLTRTMLVGDDLTVTNLERLETAVAYGACKAFIFKPNQVGTVSECMAAAAYAKEHGILSIPSIRAGGVNDDPIVDMAIALGSPCIKSGPPRNGQSIHCYNTLTRCEDENPGAAPFDFAPYIRF